MHGDRVQEARRHLGHGTLRETIRGQGQAKYNSRMGLATIAVAIGILGEYIAHFVFTKEKKNKMEWVCTVLFALLVVGGVSGEYWYGKQLSETVDSLQRLSDGEVANANKNASEADEGAKKVEAASKGLDKQISEAKAQVASANAASPLPLRRSVQR
jgi:hypothetical protein